MAVNGRQDNSAEAAIPLVGVQSALGRETPDSEHVNEVHIPRGRIHWWDKIGFIGILALSIGSSVPITVMILLGFLWQESMVAVTAGIASKSLMHRILASGWATRTVTICTSLTRIIMGIQAATVSSMFAATFIQAVGVPLSQLPAYLAAMAVQPNPLNLILSCHGGIGSFRSVLLFGLLSVEVAIVGFSQFMSTLLLSDFASIRIAGISNSTSIGVSTNGARAGQFIKYWTSAPANNWRWAENATTLSRSTGIEDTGHSYRAFLPLTQQTSREQLRSFEGTTQIVDTRTVCIRPTINDLSLQKSFAGYLLRGTLSVDKHYPGLLGTPTNATLNINCFMSFVASSTFYGGNADAKQSLLCVPGRDGNWTVSVENPLVDMSNITNQPSTYYPSQGRFLIVDFVSPGFLKGEQLNNTNLSVKTGAAEGTWVTAYDAQNEEIFRATFCQANLVTWPYTVNITSTADGAEPSIFWDTERQVFNTKAVLKQYGAVNGSLNLLERGIMGLDSMTRLSPDSLMGITMAYVNAGLFVSLIESAMPSQNLSFGYQDTSDHSVILSNQTLGLAPAHDTHVALFQDILRTTESPALALESLLWRICQMMYNEIFSRPYEKEEASTVFSTDILMPVRWTGYMIACFVLLTHFVIVIAFSSIFTICTQGLMLGNFWQAMSSIISKETLPILKAASLVMDKDVKRWFDTQYTVSNRTHVIQQYRDGDMALEIRHLKSE